MNSGLDRVSVFVVEAVSLDVWGVWAVAKLLMLPLRAGLEFFAPLIHHHCHKMKIPPPLPKEGINGVARGGTKFFAPLNHHHHHHSCKCVLLAEKGQDVFPWANPLHAPLPGHSTRAKDKH